MKLILDLCFDLMIIAIIFNFIMACALASKAR